MSTNQPDEAEVPELPEFYESPEAIVAAFDDGTLKVTYPMLVQAINIILLRK